MRWTPPSATLPAAAAAARVAAPAASAEASHTLPGSARVVPPRTDDRRTPSPAPRPPAARSAVAAAGVHEALRTAARRPRTPLTPLIGYLLAAPRRRLLRDLRRHAEWAAQARTAPTLQSRMDGHSL